MEDISDSEIRNRPGGELNGEITASELRSECCDSGNDLICGSDNVSDGEVLKRNEFSFKSDSRVCIGSNAAKYKLMSPARLPISRSPCLTIPPGLSPTSLLDSPILLSNAMAEPSPTTGSFSKAQTMHSMIGSTTLSSNTDSSKSNNYQERCSNVFEFKPQISLSSVSGISSLGPVAYAGSDYKLCEKIMPVQDQCQSLRSLSSSEKMKTSSELNHSIPDPYPSLQMDTSRASVPTVISSDKLQQQEGSDTGVYSSESIHKVSDPSTLAEKSSEDGYNWRKYGQKHVKGSEFPRSYYKCTHPNCEVKKQLERSLDGRITEIIYKGRHDHPKPQPRRQFATSTILSIQGEAPGLTGTEDESTNVHGQTSHHIEQNDTPGHSPVIANDEDRIYDEIDDEEDDDPELKRRKTVMSDVDVTSVVKPIREPRVVVQTVSEVDILDDGYRWRKYGQKVVKGNPNPRSYYKCTNTGCPVRKHVERAYNDPTAVITTYEGKHNHDVPAARNSSHDTGGSSIYRAALNSTARIIPEDSETISLDLGVGINLSPENGSNDKLETAESVMSQSYFGCKGIRATPVSAYCHVLGDGVDRYASTIQEGRDSFSFQASPLNHTHNQFPRNVGRLLSGP